MYFLFKIPNHHENVLSLSIPVESLENLIKVFLVIFSALEIQNFKQLAFFSINR